MGRIRRLVTLALAVGLAAALAPAAAAAPRSAGSSGVGDPFFPLGGNGGYHVGHYDLALDYVPSTRQLTGTATIAATATQDLDRFDLDLLGLTVDGVTVDGAAATFTRNGQELVVTPAHAAPNGQAFTVVVRYHGQPKAITDPDGSPDGWIVTDDGAFVAGEPNGAMTWFPCNNHPLDKSSYTTRITVPDGVVGVGNGRLTSRTSQGGKTTFVWDEPEAMAAYLATATVGKFKLTHSTTPGGLPVWVAVDPRQATRAKAVLKKIPQIVQWESSVYGPYPYSATGAIVDQANVGFALEVQTRPLFPGAPGLSTLVHELAHQWFGDSVSLARWKDMWLNEGFAVYTEWLYAETHGGRTTQQAFDSAYTTPASNTSFWNPPSGDPGEPKNLFVTSIYVRGAMTLQVLRKAVGDQTFLDILKTWAHDHRAGNGTIDAFVALAKAKSGMDLSTLFQRWLFTPGKPPLT